MDIYIYACNIYICCICILHIYICEIDWAKFGLKLAVKPATPLKKVMHSTSGPSK